MRRRRIRRGASGQVVAEITGQKHTVIIFELGPWKCLRFQDDTGLIQGRIHREEPMQFGSEYLMGHLAAARFHPAPERILCLGLGIGALPRLLSASYPTAIIDCVEHCDAVIQAATEHFNLPINERLRVHYGSAQDFVRDNTHTYDLVFFDCYTGHGLATGCLTESFQQHLLAQLEQTGILVVNLLPKRRGASVFSAFCAGSLRAPLIIPCPTKSNQTLFGSPARQLDLEEAMGRGCRDGLPQTVNHEIRAALFRARPFPRETGLFNY